MVCGDDKQRVIEPSHLFYTRNQAPDQLIHFFHGIFYLIRLRLIDVTDNIGRNQSDIKYVRLFMLQNP